MGHARREIDLSNCVMWACGRAPIVGYGPKRGAIETKSDGTRKEHEYDEWSDGVGGESNDTICFA